jgi:hypothetical protein
MSTGPDDAPGASTAPSTPAPDRANGAASAGAEPDSPADVSKATDAPAPPGPDAPKRTGKPQTTARERAERKREEKLESVREEVKAGSLIIRQMTDEERARYPPRENAPRPKRFGR